MMMRMANGGVSKKDKKVGNMPPKAPIYCTYGTKREEIMGKLPNLDYLDPQTPIYTLEGTPIYYEVEEYMSCLPAQPVPAGPVESISTTTKEDTTYYSMYAYYGMSIVDPQAFRVITNVS